jgi:hypothetical protein
MLDLAASAWGGGDQDVLERFEGALRGLGALKIEPRSWRTSFSANRSRSSPRCLDGSRAG